MSERRPGLTYTTDRFLEIIEENLRNLEDMKKDFIVYSKARNDERYKDTLEITGINDHPHKLVRSVRPSWSPVRHLFNLLSLKILYQSLVCLNHHYYLESNSVCQNIKD